MNHRSALLLLVLTVMACRSSDDKRPAPPQIELPPQLTQAAPSDLVRELDDADRRGTWNEVKRRWQGQVLRWTVTRQKMLCKTAESCNVSAFGIQRPAPAGWLPTLRFAPGQFAALEARCGDKDVCDIMIEGKLEKLNVSGELPTNLEITGVKIVDKQG
jgi:hypothetical protein